MLDRITELTGRRRAGALRGLGLRASPATAAAHNLNYWQFGDYLGIGAGAHSKLSFAHRIVRQVRYREPRLYMDNALAGQAVAQDDEVSRAELPFEFMLNALRLKEGFALAAVLRAHRAARSPRSRSGLQEAEQQGPDRARLCQRPADRARLRFPERPADDVPGGIKKPGHVSVRAFVWGRGMRRSDWVDASQQQNTPSAPSARACGSRLRPTPPTAGRRSRRPRLLRRGARAGSA